MGERLKKVKRVGRTAPAEGDPQTFLPGDAFRLSWPFVRRVLHLPDRGRLIVATDVQGNVADFDRVATIFEDAARSPEGAYLVVTGDLVHGPELTEAEWPDYLGTFYNGDSKTVLQHARELAQRHPGRVHYL